MKKVITILFILVFTVSVNAQSKFSLGIDGGLASPSGDVGDIYDSGFGLRISGHYPLSTNLSLFGSVGYYTWQFKQDYFDDLTGGTVDVEVDAPLTNIPIVVGANYFLSSGKFKPYLSLELGLHMLSVDSPTISAQGQTIETESASESGAGWGIGAGFLYEFSPSLSLDVIAKFNGNNHEFSQTSSSSNGGSVSSSSSSSTMTYLTISGGVRIVL